MNFLNTIEPPTNEVEVLYSIQDAAEAVNVKPSTISKYCTALDKQGYQFEKKPDGNRKLREQEIAIFRKIGELKEKHTVEKAIETIVLAWKKDMHIESLVKPAEVTTEQVLEMFKEVMNGMHHIQAEMNEIKKDIFTIKEGQPQLSAPPEQLLLVEESLNKQNNNFNEMMQTVHKATEEQTKIMQANTDLMKEFEQSHKEEKNNSDEFMKDFTKQSQQLIDTGIQKAVQETMKQQEDLRDKQPRRGWLQRFFGK